MQLSSTQPSHRIRDTLDRAVMLCRREFRTIVSHLVVFQGINLALLSLLYPLLGLASSPAVFWGVPFYIGNPFLLFDLLFFTQRALDPRFAAILIGDSVVVLTCLRVLFIPRFARHFQPHIQPVPTGMHFRKSAVSILVCSSILFGLLAITALLVRSIIPFTLLGLVLLPPTATSSLGRLLLASTLFLLAAPLIGGRFALAPPLSLLEQGGSFRSLVRSWHLTQPAWRAVFGLTLLIDGLMALVIFLPATLPLFAVVTPLHMRQVSALIRVSVLALSGLSLIIVPFQSAITTILYYELRQRIEGADLEERIKAITSINISEAANRDGA
jgi:hypothetical protein